MKNMQSPSPGGSYEYNEYEQHKVEAKQLAIDTHDHEFLLNYLIDGGFAWEEAVMLLNLREHLYENDEMRQRMESDHRMHFARWLCQNGEMSEL